MDIWYSHTKGMNFDTLVESVEKPSFCQIELRDIINKLYNEPKTSIAEIGCETGISSLLLSDRFEKTLLDLNPDAICLAKQIFYNYNKNANFVVADMFNMPFANGTFDIVFNAGVLEHFKRDEVVNALMEYKRILKNNGLIIIGIPNFLSIPFKTAQLVKRLFGRWNYPHEYCYYNLKREINKAGLVLEERKILSKQSIYDWWNFFPPIKKFFQITDFIFKWQGYLILLIIKKN